MCLNNSFQYLNTKTRTSMKPNQHLMPPSPHPLPHPTLTLSLNHHHLFFIFATLTYSSSLSSMLSSIVQVFPISLPLQASNHVLTKPSNLVPAPLAIPNIPTIETSQNICPTSQSSDHGGSKRSSLLFYCSQGVEV